MIPVIFRADLITVRRECEAKGVSGIRFTLKDPDDTFVVHQGDVNSPELIDRAKEVGGFWEDSDNCFVVIPSRGSDLFEGNPTFFSCKRIVRMTPALQRRGDTLG